MHDPDDTTAAFRLRTGYHFRKSAALLLTLLVLGPVTWLQDEAASRAGGGIALVLAAALGLLLGLVLLACGITAARDLRGYLLALRGGRPALLLSVHPEGVILYLLDATLSWREAGQVQVIEEPRGRFLPGPLARRLQPARRAVFRPEHVLPGYRVPALLRTRAARFVAAYRTPFAVDLAEAAASPTAVTAALRKYSRHPVQLLTPHEAAGHPGQPPDPAGLAAPAFGGWQARRARKARKHSWYQRFIAPFALALAIAAAGWVTAMPFRYAWLMQHGQPAIAEVLAITNSCQDRAPASFLIGFTGPGNIYEEVDTSAVWGCPPPHTYLDVKYDPADPGNVGDVRVLRTRPFPLLALAFASAAFGWMAVFAIQIWRHPQVGRHPDFWELALL